MPDAKIGQESVAKGADRLQGPARHS